MIDDLVRLLGAKRFPLSSEAELQAAIAQTLSGADVAYEREVRLSRFDVVDFMVGSIAIEAKIKGGKLAIFRQCERYCGHESVAALIIATSAPLALPPAIAGKPAYLVDLGRAWL